MTEGSNRFNVPVLCFRDAGQQLICDAWYEHKEDNACDERLRIVKKAVKIIRQDIQSELYTDDKYPLSDDFLKAAEALPQTLLTFLENVMMKVYFDVLWGPT